MAFTYRSNGKQYTLYTRELELKSGVQRVYFFSSNDYVEGEPADKPKGYYVKVERRTGFPILKKK